MTDEKTQWFRGTSGFVWGILALILAAVLIVVDVIGGWDAPVVTGGLLFGVLAYLALIRPRIGVARDELVLDHMLTTVRIPVAAVQGIAISRMCEVRAGGRRYLSAAVSRSVRQALRREVVRDSPLQRRVPVEEPKAKAADISYADFVAGRIHAVAHDARERAGIAAGSAEQTRLADGVRRTWAWPEVVVLSVVAVAFVVSLAL